MRVSPGTTTIVAAGESPALELDGIEWDGASMSALFGGEFDLDVSGGRCVLPFLQAPDRAVVEWMRGAAVVATTGIASVARHYFALDELRGFGDGQDAFNELPDDVLAKARDAATEVFERAANRSFVVRVGSAVDYGTADPLYLYPGDVREVLTPGYRLVTDCQAVRDPGVRERCPQQVEYTYGTGDMPAQVSRAVLELAAYMLRPTNRPVGATGESTDAGYIHFTTAGRDGATDIPEVNAVIEQFGRAVCPVW